MAERSSLGWDEQMKEMMRWHTEFWEGRRAAIERRRAVKKRGLFDRIMRGLGADQDAFDLVEEEGLKLGIWLRPLGIKVRLGESFRVFLWRDIVENPAAMAEAFEEPVGWEMTIGEWREVIETALRKRGGRDG